MNDLVVPRIFLTAEWRYLAMLNYEIDPVILAPFLPLGTELDFFRGKTFVSMVGFRFLKTKVLGLPVPFHRNFDEVNLRFYVRRETTSGWRRGVVFIKEIVPKRLVAWVARTFYYENYIRLPMTHLIRDPGQIRYAWRWQGKEQFLAGSMSGEPNLPDEGSEAFFIQEHYWGYARQPDGSTVEYQVEHPRWRIRALHQPEFVCDVASLYGESFAVTLAKPPSSAFLAEGSAVVVRKGRTVAQP